jgi:hypothetical protein
VTLTGIRSGDIVECDVRGERFFAFASSNGKGEIEVESLHCHRFRIVTARQVVGHWRKRKARAV